FDDGPSPWTADLIRTLQKEDVPAVFFWNTYHIQYANDDVKQLLANDSDIQVGDHTVDHPDLIHLGYEDQYAEIADAKRLIEQTTGQPVRFFRPPYGDYNATTEQVLRELGLHGVMWDVDTLDWKFNDREQPILDTIRREVHPGSIILMHDHPYTVRFLPDIIDELRQLGYGFTTLTVPQAHAALMDPPPGRVRYI
ncbi:MAG: polysaccharide deacetylase family protein, partial [Alicyclobacillus sp.]|nr:polysaccharide deacetylase family protein [Alicyclobacillus sp.]